MKVDPQQRYREQLIYEQEAFRAGAARVVGVDEAGRGPVAGPIFAACVELDPDYPILGLQDSKKLSPKRREVLCAEIEAHARQYAVASLSAEEIDQLGIAVANARVLQEAVQKLITPPDWVLADYFSFADTPWHWQGIVKGDSLSNSIAAASILAKVYRDRYLLQVETRYPGYGFAQHKGYGTAAHRSALLKLGLCPEHRRSFLHKWGYT